VLRTVATSMGRMRLLLRSPTRVRAPQSPPIQATTRLRRFYPDAAKTTFRAPTVACRLGSRAAARLAELLGTERSNGSVTVAQARNADMLGARGDEPRLNVFDRDCRAAEPHAGHEIDRAYPVRKPAPQGAAGALTICWSASAVRTRLASAVT
jgi:hypothetical protein